MVVRCIAEHVASASGAATRNSIFMTLFPAAGGIGGDPASDARIRILGSLVALAVATHNVAVLQAAAVWMQQASCLSSRCCHISFGLVQDVLCSTGNGSGSDHLDRALCATPGAAPLFAANLVTSLAQVYSKIGTLESCDIPPPSLLRLVVRWLRDHPSLFLAPLSTSLDGISLPMTPVLAVAPLAKWCVESSLFFPAPALDVAELYSELHLYLLLTMTSVSSLKPQGREWQVICAEHIRNIVDVLNVRLKNLGNNDLEEAAREVALNRLAQIVLVALNSKCITGRLADMWNSIKKLPASPRLMRTLLNYNPC